MAISDLLPWGIGAAVLLAMSSGASLPPPPFPPQGRPNENPFPQGNPFPPPSPSSPSLLYPHLRPSLPEDVISLLPSHEHFVSIQRPTLPPSQETVQWSDPAYEAQFGYPPNLRSSDLMRRMQAKQTPILEAGIRLSLEAADALRQRASLGEKNPSAGIYLDTEESVDFFANMMLGFMLLHQTPQGRQSPAYWRFLHFFRLHRFGMEAQGPVWKETLFLANRMACGGAYSYLTSPADEKNYTEALLRPAMRPWKEWTGVNASRPEGYASGFAPSEDRACSLFAIRKEDGRWTDANWQSRNLLSARIQGILADGLLCLLENAIPRYTNTVFLSAIDPKTAGQIATGLATGGANSLASFLRGDVVGGVVNLVIAGITAAIQVAGQFDKDREIRMKANASIEAFMQQALGLLPRPDRVPSVVTTNQDGVEFEYRWPLSSTVTWLSGFQLPLLLSPLAPFDAVNHWDASTPVFFHYGAIKGFTAANPFVSPNDQIPALPMLLAQPPFLYRKIPYAMIFGTGGIGDKWLLQPSSFVDSSARLVQWYKIGRAHV